MLDYGLLVVVVAVIAISLIGYMVAKASTSETSYEQSVGQQKEELNNLTKSKSKKPKPGKFKQMKDAPSAASHAKETVPNPKKAPTQNNSIAKVKISPIVETKAPLKKEITPVEPVKKTVKTELPKKKKEAKITETAVKVSVPEPQPKPAAKTIDVLPTPLTNGDVDVKQKEMKPARKTNEKKKQTNKETDFTQDMVEEDTQVVAKVPKEKKKPATVSAIVPVTSFKTLTASLNNTELTNSQIQMLVEGLLNKQHLQAESMSEWVSAGKVDPMSTMKKQMTETQQSLTEQKETNSALMAKIMVLRNDLNSERQKANLTTKQMLALNNEFSKRLDAAALISNDQVDLKVKEISSSMEQEYQKTLIQQKHQMEAEFEALQQKFALNQNELETQMQQVQCSRSELEGKLSQAVHQYEQRNSSVDAAYAESENQRQSIIQTRDELAKTCQQYQQHINTLTEQNAQKESAFGRQVHELQSNLKSSDNARTQALTQYSQISGEREQLVLELKNLENIREIYSQHQSTMKGLRMDNNELEARLGKSEFEKTDMQEVVKRQISQIESLGREKDALLIQVDQSQANGKHPEENHDDSSSETIAALTDELALVKKSLESHQNKNDEEKRKYEEDRVKAMQVILQLIPEAKAYQTHTHSSFLAEAEKSVPKVQAVPKQKQNEDAKLLKQFEELQTNNAKLEEQVTQLKSEKSSLAKELAASKCTKDQDTKLEQLVDENQVLNKKVSNYQEVLSNTESLLKSLQISVESEETLWKEKIAASDVTITELKADKHSLTQKLFALESTLDQKVTSLQESLQQQKQIKEGLEEKLQQALNQVPFSLNQVPNTNGIETAESFLSKLIR